MLVCACVKFNLSGGLEKSGRSLLSCNSFLLPELDQFMEFIVSYSLNLLITSFAHLSSSITYQEYKMYHYDKDGIAFFISTSFRGKQIPTHTVYLNLKSVLEQINQNKWHWIKFSLRIALEIISKTQYFWNMEVVLQKLKELCPNIVLTNEIH